MNKLITIAAFAKLPSPSDSEVSIFQSYIFFFYARKRKQKPFKLYWLLHIILFLGAMKGYGEISLKQADGSGQATSHYTFKDECQADKL